jgi:hypothetical protein
MPDRATHSPKSSRRYEVRHDGFPVLLFRPRAGLLLSTAPRPPGYQAPKHPFVDARALDAGHEHQLAEILSECRSATQFIGGLRAAGYEVTLEEQ